MIDQYRYYYVKNTLQQNGVDHITASRLAHIAAVHVPMNPTNFENREAFQLYPIIAELRRRDMAKLEEYYVSGVLKRPPTLDLNVDELFGLSHTYYGQRFIAGYSSWITDEYGVTYPYGTGGCPVGAEGEIGKQG